jgi:taurine dioxygenase
MSMRVVATGAALGARIEGVDLRQPLDQATFEAVKRAFYRYEVIYFRGTELTDEDHIRFSARFGALRRIKLDEVHERHPEIFVVSNVKQDGKYIGSYDAGIFWHTDGAYLAHPHAISALYAHEVPEQDGRVLGDTRYASMTAAYDALPGRTKQRIEGLQALHSIIHRHRKTLEVGVKKEYNAAIKADPEAVHPVVRLHPVTGRKCLFVTEGYTVKILGLPEEESRELLAELVAHCTQPQFQYVHNWRAHDLVMWDDCATQHKATFDYPPTLRRRMHRTTVIDSPPRRVQAEPAGAVHG